MAVHPIRRHCTSSDRVRWCWSGALLACSWLPWWLAWRWVAVDSCVAGVPLSGAARAIWAIRRGRRSRTNTPKSRPASDASCP